MYSTSFKIDGYVNALNILMFIPLFVLHTIFHMFSLIFFFQYQLLTSELFRSPSHHQGPTKRLTSKRSREGSPLHQNKEDRTYNLRSSLYDKLASHFPEAMTHPRGHLIDLIPYTSSLSNDNILS